MTLTSQSALESNGKRAAVLPTRPGPGRPTREQVERRNVELLDRALDLFLERGFERTTIDAIAMAVGMAKRTVYARYEDKATLFRAALQRAIDDWVVPVETLRAAEDEADFESGLLNIARILIANLMSPEGLRLMRITNSESYRMPEIGIYTYERGTRQTIDYLADLFRRRSRQNGVEMPEAEAAALMFLSLVVGEPARNTAWGLEVDQSAIDQHAQYRVRVFLHGLFPTK